MSKEAIVAIVGRPNVGKSSLFNRLVGKRDAIVDDQPGVTRDRHYGKVEWTGNLFTIIDTGGYLPESEELFDIAIKEQVEIAIEQADLIIFLCDVQTSVTNTDHQIAKMLQRINKETILAINKVDDNRTVNEVYEFYSLALGEPIPVSAMQGRNSGDLLDAITNRIQTLQNDQEEDDSLKLAIIGRENVGKSSFVNALIGEKRNIVTNVAGTTRDSNDSNFKYFGRDITLIDTAGLKRKTKVKENVLFYSQIRTLQSLERADVVIYITDADNKLTKQDLRILSDIIEKQKGLILAVNKWDLIEEKNDKKHRDFREEIISMLPNLKFVPVITMSVKEKQRVRKIIDEALEVDKRRRQRIQTAELNDFFIPLIKENKPPANLGRTIKINYITQVAENPPVLVFFCNDPDNLAMHYKRFLENQFHKRFDFKGVSVKFHYRKKNIDRHEMDDERF